MADTAAHVEGTRLPKGWKSSITNDNNKRVYYYKETETQAYTFDHPSRGPLPHPWILRRRTRSTDGQYEYEYKNLKTNGRSRNTDPRHSTKALNASHAKLPPHRRVSGYQYKPDYAAASVDLNQLEREPIGSSSGVQADYYRLKQLSGGAMNAGVFVVCLKKQLSNFHVEKCFKSSDRYIAVREIKFIHRFRHGALSMYTGGFIEAHPFQASVYVEMCDLGDLQDLINLFAERRARRNEMVGGSETLLVPVSFAEVKSSSHFRKM
jgi:hypothetical protein